MASRSSPARSSGVRASSHAGGEGPKPASHDLSITPHEGETMSLRTLAMVGAALAVLGPAMLAAQSVGSYNAVTEQRLLNPEPQNWLMYRGNYAGWGYSPLDQITTQNARKLTPVWTLGTGVAEGHESPPMVNNGVMFVSTPQNQVLALDAKNGDVLWYYT